MQITRQTEYAIRTLIELSKLSKGTFLQTKTISERQNIPEIFLKKTIQLLAYAGLVKTMRGSKGGVALKIPSKEITIANVLESIEGKLNINPCLGDSKYCNNRSECQVHKIFDRAQRKLMDELNKETIEDIVNNNGIAEY